MNNCICVCSCLSVCVHTHSLTPDTKGLAWIGLRDCFFKCKFPHHFKLFTFSRIIILHAKDPWVMDRWTGSVAFFFPSKSVAPSGAWRLLNICFAQSFAQLLLLIANTALLVLLILLTLFHCCCCHCCYYCIYSTDSVEMAQDPPLQFFTIVNCSILLLIFIINLWYVYACTFEYF